MNRTNKGTIMIRGKICCTKDKCSLFGSHNIQYITLVKLFSCIVPMMLKLTWTSFIRGGHSQSSFRPLHTHSYAVKRLENFDGLSHVIQWMIHLYGQPSTADTHFCLMQFSKQCNDELTFAIMKITIFSFNMKASHQT